MNRPASATRTKQRVRTKICGVRGVDDARAAAAAGADAIGLVFYASSPRAIDMETAAAVAKSTPAFVSRVALFLDADEATVAAVVERLRPDTLQFHGSEPRDFCAGFDTPYIKTVPMGEPDIDLADWAKHYPDARGLLLDANRAGDAGGQGQAFSRSAVVNDIEQPIIIAGGLSPDNVAASIRRYAPYGVDVSSGVETRDGDKSAERMRAFVDAVLDTREPT